jgi:hypothetical protein
MTAQMAYPFPIRPKFLAQIVIPRDLTKEEADRLCAFVMSLAAPEPLLMQDENSGRDGRRYNEWHASRPDARLNAREAAASLGQEAKHG